MITVKITNSGGYICGDGQLPPGLNPDTFLKAFMNRIIDAKMQGLAELGIEDEEIQAMSRMMRDRVNQEVDDAQARVFEDVVMNNPQRLLDVAAQL